MRAFVLQGAVSDSGKKNHTILKFISRLNHTFDQKFENEDLVSSYKISILLAGDSKANCWRIITGSHSLTDFWAVYFKILGSVGSKEQLWECSFIYKLF